MNTEDKARKFEIELAEELQRALAEDELFKNAKITVQVKLATLTIEEIPADTPAPVLICQNCSEDEAVTGYHICHGCARDIWNNDDEDVMFYPDAVRIMVDAQYPYGTDTDDDDPDDDDPIGQGDEESYGTDEPPSTIWNDPDEDCVTWTDEEWLDLD